MYGMDAEFVLVGFVRIWVSLFLFLLGFCLGLLDFYISTPGSKSKEGLSYDAATVSGLAFCTVFISLWHLFR
jgi:hypothetical protein